MNRKLGQLIKAAVVTLPLALPGVAFAQSANTPSSGGTYDNTDKQNQAPIDKSMQDKNVQPESSGVTGQEKTPPAGDLDTSGTSKSATEHGGDINKPSKMDTETNKTDTETTKSKSKKEHDTGTTPGSDVNQ